MVKHRSWAAVSLVLCRYYSRGPQRLAGSAKLDDYLCDGVECDGSLRLRLRAVVDSFMFPILVRIIGRIHCTAGCFALYGTGKGDQVAIWESNSGAWIVAAFVLLTADVVLVPFNTRLKAAYATGIIFRSIAKSMLVEKCFLGKGFSDSADVAAIYLKSDFLASDS
nr:AMP-binding protein [Mycobacterium uberis]